MIRRLPLPPSIAVLALIALAFVLPGLAGHTPWKSFDVIQIEIVHQMHSSGDWLVPQVAREPWLEDPPLYAWVGLAFANALGRALPFHEAVRLASGAFLFAAFGLLYLAARQWAPQEQRRAEAASAVLLLLIGVAAFHLIATLIMVVMEKRKDIAVLLAMGAKRRDVWRIFVLKGLVVGAAGTAAGLLLGATACFALERYHFIRIPREIYGISTVPVTVEPSNFVLVALASLGLCLIATFYPARRASREMPVEVFRS